MPKLRKIALVVRKSPAGRLIKAPTPFLLFACMAVKALKPLQPQQLRNKPVIQSQSQDASMPV